MALSIQQIADSAGKKFLGWIANNAGTNVATAPKGVNYGTQNGDVVSDLSVHVTDASGAGATIGATGDAAVITDANGTLSAKLRGVIALILDRLPSGANTAHDAADTGAPLKIGGKASSTPPTPVASGDRVNAWFDISGVQYVRDEYADTVLGQTSDVALLPDNSGSISAKLRGLHKVTGAIDDAAVSTDANGTVSAKLRGLIVLLVNLLSRWPASLGQKAKTASLPVVIASDQDALRIASGATDAAAQAGEIFPGAAVYLTNPITELTAGQIGIPRMNKRRIMMGNARGYYSIKASGASVALAGDMTASTTSRFAGYVAPTTTHFTWSGTSEARWYSVPYAVDGWRDIGMFFQSNLDVALRLTFRYWLTGSNDASDKAQFYQRDLAAGTLVNYQPGYGGQGQETSPIPLFHNGAGGWLVIEVDPLATATGTIEMGIARFT